VESLVAAGHPVFELMLMKRDLETVFREVNESPASQEMKDAA
jgi:hypothetical protein